MSYLIPCSKEAKKNMEDKDGSKRDLGYLLIIIGFGFIVSTLLLNVIIPIAIRWWFR